jgi:hypothetical protein
VTTPQNRVIPENAGRLFSTLVLMGTGMAMSCGGEVNPDGGGSASGGGAGNAPNGSGGGTAAGGVSSGGASSVGGGGIIIIGDGGAPAAGGSMEIGGAAGNPGWYNEECSPSQWECGAGQTDYGGCGYQIPDGCTCDDEKPEFASDCGPGEIQTCLKGTSGPDGASLSQAVPFSCRCVPDGEANCTNECGGLFYCDRVWESRYEQVICGCEIPVLR